MTRYSPDMEDTVERFVADLAAEVAPTLVNQYAVEIPGIDGPRGASIRRANLRTYLEPRIGRPLALIGEAPSAHRARFSGIAFTAERSLPPDRRTSAPGLRAGGFRALGEGGRVPGADDLCRLLARLRQDGGRESDLEPGARQASSSSQVSVRIRRAPLPVTPG